MRRLTLATATLMAVGFMGCDRLPFIGGEDETPAAQEQQAVPADTQQAVDSAEATAQPTPPPVAPQPQTQPAPQTTVRTTVDVMMDEPWTPTHTGTVEPGMTLEQVVAVWGEPVTERSLANWTYLYFRNGCEVSCGTFDVVLLEGGQVVDAIVRGPGHTYAGVSSSPPDREAAFTPPTSG